MTSQYPYGPSSPYQPPPYAPPPSYQPQQFWTPPPVPRRKRAGRRLAIGVVGTAAVVAATVGGVLIATNHSGNGPSQQTALTAPNSSQVNPFSGNGEYPFGSGGSGQYPFGGSGSDGSGSDGSGSSGSSAPAAGKATDVQSVGVVDINTTLDFGEGKAAGTGIVLTADGQVLTNNHVVEDSTAISVTVVSTGKTYTATVVGTDPTDDVAVIKLADASGLATAKLGDSDGVAVGDAITGVGNAGGTGGTPSAATGTVFALNQSITASDGSGANAEQLTGMIGINADIQAGDSGGPLYENKTGTVVGIDTAASSSSSGFHSLSGSTTGYAIPINKALGIAKQIVDGQASDTIHLGYPAFLGVELSSDGGAGGAAVAGVVNGSAAEKAGLAAGDVITSLDGTAVASASELSTAMGSHKPGDQVSVGWTDASGQSNTASITLGSGPAD